MLRTASISMGREKKNESVVVPNSRPQVVDRSAVTGMVVREPLEVGLSSAKYFYFQSNI